MKTDDTITPYRTKSTLELAVEADPSLIHGVAVPWDVQIQLKEAGYIASQLMSGELREANAASISGRVFNEPEGSSFADRLRRTADETQPPTADDDDADPGADDDGGKKHKPRALAEDQRRKHGSFVKDLLEKRAEQLKLMATGHMPHELS